MRSAGTPGHPVSTNLRQPDVQGAGEGGGDGQEGGEPGEALAVLPLQEEGGLGAAHQVSQKFIFIVKLKANIYVFKRT